MSTFHSSVRHTYHSRPAYRYLNHINNASTATQPEMT